MASTVQKAEVCQIMQATHKSVAAGVMNANLKDRSSSECLFVKHGRGSVMLWGCILVCGAGDFVKMEACTVKFWSSLAWNFCG